MDWRDSGRSRRRSCGCGHSRIEGWPCPWQHQDRSGRMPAPRKQQEAGGANARTVVQGRIRMSRKQVVLALAAGLAGAALAQNEQFIAALVYRTGAYAPNGVPFANGIADYYALLNERDGGINGVKITWEECEFGYATDRGVECYERLKNKGPTGTAFINPFSTGVTFALTEKTAADKIPLIHMGYGRSESRDGSVFPYNFPLLGTYWTAADIILQYISKQEGG